ncbi:MAG TPA: outer membrane lipoprotein carrier protein LolA [Bryobacteraceae bacterium]|nr:outer membrane lipoprotein carrier protein LolA [Bryobacteraceae bacterium]
MLLVVSALASAGEMDALLKQIESRYNSAKTLQVLFQEQYTRPGEIRRTESGTLLLRKPGRMRWSYTQPIGKLFVSDGKYLYLYTPDSNQVEKTKLQETADMRAPLAFLLGKLNFQKDFRNVQGKPEGPLMRITAEPKTDNLPYSAVEFLVQVDGIIRQVKVTAFDKSIIDFTFSEEKMDPPLDAKLFQFQMPPGAKLVDEGQ